MIRTAVRTVAVFLATLPVIAAVTPRDGWQLVPGGEDLIQNGNWACVSGVSATARSIRVVASPAGYNTVINTTGPTLRVGGDFSVFATLASASSNGTLTLVGNLNNGEWWNGLKRLDVGLANGILQMSYWTGTSSNTAGAQSFGAPPPGDGGVTLEVARIGAQIAVFANGKEMGRFGDPGLFASGVVYLGFNVPPSNAIDVNALSAAVPAGVAAQFFDPTTQVVTKPVGGLRDFSGKSGIMLGAAVNPALLADLNYARVLGSQNTIVVPENAMKFADTEQGPYQYNFCSADSVVRFAEANGLKVRGHTLVWHQALPAWLTSGNYSTDDTSKILKDHIQTVMSRYKGRVFAWDVVNEAIAYGAPYGAQPSFWATKLGPGYVEQAFRWARQADPAAKLFYNDTGGEGLGAKSDAVYNLVADLVNRGVPIDGVGLQMHISAANPPSTADISANIRRLAALGLEVHITEMDVRIPVPASQADLILQANVYKSVADACLANTNCTAILTWGVSDAASWIPGQYPGFGAALLFDSLYQAKPAASTLLTTLTDAAAKPRIFYGGAVVHGGNAQVVSPGSLVDLYGVSLSSSVLNLDSGVTKLPQSLGNVQVSVNGVAAPLLYAGPGQTIFQMPYEAPSGMASIAVLSNGNTSPVAPIRVQAAAPSLLTWSTNRVVALNADGTVNSATNCAAPGSIAVAFAMGSGPVDNKVPTGALAPLAPLSRETLPTTVTVGGQLAEVLFAGFVPTTAALMQINFRVPTVSAGDSPMQLIIGSAGSNQPSFCVAQQ